MNAPCLNCNDRDLTCHSVCLKYKEYKESINKYNNSMKNTEYNGYIVETLIRMKANR